MKADLALVSPGFFAALDIGLLRGRDFNWQDNEHAPQVAILSQTLARRLFPAGNVLGQRVNIGTDPQRQNLEVVGIVTDTHLFDIRSPNVSTVYMNVLQAGDFAQWGNLEVRATGNPLAIASAVQNTVGSLGHEYVLNMRTLKQVEDQALLNERMTAMLSELFGAIALLVAGTGLYGLMAYTVAQRTRELGLRMALGARPGGILWLVLRESLALIAAGLAIGIPLALAAARLVGHMLYGLSPNDPLTLAVALLALVMAMLLAGYLPARRAMKVDPVEVLRYE
jgi:predicted permease